MSKHDKNKRFEQLSCEFVRLFTRKYDEPIYEFVLGLNSDDKKMLSEIIEENKELFFKYIFLQKSVITNNAYFTIISDYASVDFIVEMLDIQNISDYTNSNLYKIKLHMNGITLAKLIQKTKTKLNLFDKFFKVNYTSKSMSNFFWFLLDAYQSDERFEIIKSLSNQDDLTDILGMIVYTDGEGINLKLNLFEFMFYVGGKTIKKGCVLYELIKKIVSHLEERNSYEKFITEKCDINFITTQIICKSGYITFSTEETFETQIFQIIWRPWFLTKIDPNCKNCWHFSDLFGIFEASIFEDKFEFANILIEIFPSIDWNVSTTKNGIGNESHNSSIISRILYRVSIYEYDANVKNKIKPHYKYLEKILYFILSDVVKKVNVDSYSTQLIAEYFYPIVKKVNLEFVEKNINAFISHFATRMNVLTLNELVKTKSSVEYVLNYCLRTPNPTYEYIDWSVKKFNEYNLLTQTCEFAQNNTIIDAFIRICEISLCTTANLFYENIIKDSIEKLINLKYFNNEDKLPKTEDKKKTKSKKNIITINSNDAKCERVSREVFYKLVCICAKNNNHDMVINLFSNKSLHKYFVFVHENTTFLQMFINLSYPNDFIEEFIEQLGEKCFPTFTTKKTKHTALIDACFANNHEIVLKLIEKFGNNLYSVE